MTALNDAMNKQRTMSLTLWFFVAAGMLLNAAKLVHHADVQPYFVDEILNAQAASTLFREGNYSGWFIGGNFPTGISSGIAATWVSGLVFLFGGNLFLARLLTGLFVFAQLLILIFLFARRKFSEPAVAMAVAVILTSLLFHLPYWFGFIQSLGEMQGALFVGWGLLILGRCPLLSFFLLGVAVWHCKLMYLPMTGLLIAAYVVSEEGGWKKKIGAAVKAGLMFMLPMMLWWALIWIRFDLPTVLASTRNYIGFASGYHSGVSGASPSAGWTLGQRLERLEWANLSLVNRTEMLILFLGPLVLTAIVLPRYFTWRNGRRDILLFLAAVTALLLYMYWYFLVSPMMWVRQVSPGLYLGFALIFFLAARVRAFFTRTGAAVLGNLILAALVLVVVGETLWVAKALPLIQPHMTIARACYQLFNDNCYGGNEHLFKRRPY